MKSAFSVLSFVKKDKQKTMAVTLFSSASREDPFTLRAAFFGL